MAKAEIETSTGTKIFIEGSVDEIAAIISLYNKNQTNSNTRPLVVEKDQEKSSNNRPKQPTTLVEYILELRNTGFFDTPKQTVLVKEKLDQEGHFYPMQSVSTCLINRNEKKELRRVKEGTKWAYVKR